MFGRIGKTVYGDEIRQMRDCAGAVNYVVVLVNNLKRGTSLLEIKLMDLSQNLNVLNV